MKISVVDLWRFPSGRIRKVIRKRSRMFMISVRTSSQSVCTWREWEILPEGVELCKWISIYWREIQKNLVLHSRYKHVSEFIENSASLIEYNQNVHTNNERPIWRTCGSNELKLKSRKIREEILIEESGECARQLRSRVQIYKAKCSKKQRDAAALYSRRQRCTREDLLPLRWPGSIPCQPGSSTSWKN